MYKTHCLLTLFSLLTAMTHSPLILSLDTVRAWHSGPRLIVEVDIVIDQNQTGAQLEEGAVEQRPSC
jgi:hypothetical protein